MKRALGASLSVMVASSLVVGGATALAQSPTPVPVLDVEWALTQMDGEAVPADPAITATFAQSGTLTGSGGCNGYSATWTSDGTTLTVTDLLATFKACAPDVSAREDRYFQLIQAAASWALDGSAIVVTTADGSTLVFGGDQTPEGLALVGSWVLDTLDDETVPDDLVVTLDIAADGTLAGSGCNQYSATYTATKQGDLTVGDVLASRRSCGPSDEFEARYLDALQGATGWGWQLSGGGTLHLFGTHDLMLHDASVVDVTLTGQEWLLVAIDGEPADEALGQSATFGDDGTVSGSGGCNTYSGPYTVDGESLGIGSLLATRKSCGDDADASESEYLTALEAAASFAISGTELTVSTNDGRDLEFGAERGNGPLPTPTPATTPAITPEASVPAATPAATPAVTPAVTPAATPGPSGAVSGGIVGSWRMTSYMDQALPRGMLSIDITFAPDGTLSGFGGCNDYSGEWSLDSTSLSITGFEAASSGSCDATKQSFEQGFFSVLPYLDGAEVSDDGILSLTSTFLGGITFEFEAAG